MLQATPGHLVFGWNMILNTIFVDYWEASIILKQEIIDKNNQNKNKNCKLHNYIVREKVLFHLVPWVASTSTGLITATLPGVWVIQSPDATVIVLEWDR